MKNMIDQQDIDRLVETRRTWFERLGFPLKEGDETLNRLYHRGEVWKSALKEIPEGLYEMLSDTFGKAITLTVLYFNDVIYKQSGDFNRSEWKRFLNELEEYIIEDVTFTVVFDLDKCCLAQQLLEPPTKVEATVIFQNETLNRIFSVSIVELDKNSKNGAHPDSAFFIDDFCKQVILVLDLDVWVNGERLAIIGGSGLGHLKETLVPPPSGASKIQAIGKQSKNNIKWIDLSPPHLTPLHFKVEVDEKLTGKGSEDLLDLLAWLQINFSLIYLCDSVSLYDSGFLGVMFAGAGGSIQALLPGNFPWKSEAEKSKVRVALRSGAAIWLEDCIWTYEKEMEVIDRLTTVQGVIARSFPGKYNNSYFIEYLREAKKVHEIIKEHWKILTERKIDSYFERVKQIGEFVAAASRSYGEQIDTLIKSLTSTMLGAVVTVVGSFVGSLLSDKFNPLVLIIGLGVYCGYLAIFPGLIGMLYARQQFREIKKRMHHQFDELTKRALMLFESDSEWKNLYDQLSSSESRFNKWYVITAVSYGLVFILAIAAIIVLSTLFPG